jgi:hypothetical protein
MARMATFRAAGDMSQHTFAHLVRDFDCRTCERIALRAHHTEFESGLRDLRERCQREHGQDDCKNENMFHGGIS